MPVPSSAALPGPSLPKNLSTAENEKLIASTELLFFAYRDFIADPDEILSDYGFRRSHHRVLHFVNREPGLRVTDLLDILKITKQSLAPVLKPLIDQNFIVQKAGQLDRRERRLFVTEQGKELAERLMQPQLGRIYRALSEIKPENHDVILQFLYAMIKRKEQHNVANRIAKSTRDVLADLQTTITENQ
ncbi:MAG: MarR family transcriptional regulator [Pseudomonadota bacterium]